MVSRQQADSDSSERISEQISEVFESFSDFILFTDDSGRICSANPSAVEFFDGPIEERRIWNLLGVDVTGIEDFLNAYPAESVHEIPYGESGVAIPSD